MVPVRTDGSQQYELKSEPMNFKMIAMSATIDNREQFKTWLNADLVESNYRAVQLQQYIFCQDKYYNFVTHQPIPNLHFKPLCNNRIISLMCSSQKPLLVFCGSKRACM